MLERLWTSILELMAQVVTPDWGVLVSLIPVGILLLVLVILLRLFLMLAKAPPARRGKGPVRRKTPAGIHMPGPSFAPIFAGVGLFLVMLGLVFGGLILVLGIVALVLTLLYWLAEGLRVYDHDIGPTAPELPAEIQFEVGLLLEARPVGHEARGITLAALSVRADLHPMRGARSSRRNKQCSPAGCDRTRNSCRRRCSAACRR